MSEQRDFPHLNRITLRIKAVGAIFVKELFEDYLHVILPAIL